MKKKLYIIVGVIAVIIIISLGLLTFYNFDKLNNSINKCESENKSLKLKYNKLNDTIKKDESNVNTDNQINKVEKTCTYIETYEFVDYYEKNDNTLYIIVDNVKSLSKNKLPLVLELDTTKFKKDFIKNQSYEFTLKKSILYNGNTVLYDYIEIIKVEQTDKTGMEQVNEFCIFE